MQRLIPCNSSKIPEFSSLDRKGSVPSKTSPALQIVSLKKAFSGIFQNEFYIPQDRNCDFLCLCPTRGSSDRFLLFGRSFQFLCCSLKITLKLIIRSCELLSSKLQHFLAIGNIKCVWQNKNNSIEGNNYTLYTKQDFMNSH